MINVRGDVLYVGKARDLKKRVSVLHPDLPARHAAAAHGVGDRDHGVRRDPHRGRGAAAGSQPDQALPAALQRAAARRQELPLHRDHRRPSDPADHQASRRAQPDGRVFRPLRLRRRGQPHHRRPAARLPAAQLQRQHVRDAHAALPAVPDQALLRALRAAHLGGGLRRAGARGARLPDRQEPRDPGPPGAGDARGQRRAGFRARRAPARPHPGADPDPVAPGHQPRRRRRGRRDRRLAGRRPDLHPGVLLPQPRQLRQPRLFPLARQERGVARGAGRLHGPVLREQAAAAPDPGERRRRPNASCWRRR